MLADTLLSIDTEKNFNNQKKKVLQKDDYTYSSGDISFLKDNIRSKKNKNAFLKSKLPVYFKKKLIRSSMVIDVLEKSIFFLSEYTFFKKKLKLMSYLSFLKLQVRRKLKNENKNLIIQIKKKKSNYYFFLIINGKVALTASLGVALRFTGLKRKFLKRKIKSFNVILSIIKRLFKHFSRKPFIKNFIIDFLDKKIYYFHKTIKSFVKMSHLFFLNLKTNFGKNNFKKVKSIKKNSRKRSLFLFLEDLKKFSFKLIKKKRLRESTKKK